MKTLYLVRHAKSSWGEPGLADFDRPLNKRGEQDAPRMGERLKAMGVSPDHVVSSPAKRAITTARKVCEALGYPKKRIEQAESIYDARPEDTMAVIHGADPAHDSLMVFGHNPTTTDLANALANADIDNVPTLGVLCITFDTDAWTDILPGKGTLAFFEFPKLHA